MKFSEIQYARPDGEAMKAEFAALTEGLRNAKSYEEARAVFLEKEEDSKLVSTMWSLASARHSIDTRDKFYDDSQIEDLLAVYLGHAPTAFERRHYFSFIPISAWVYFCWSLFKAGVNEPNGFFMHDCYRQINKFVDSMLKEYEGGLA